MEESNENASEASIVEAFQFFCPRGESKLQANKVIDVAHALGLPITTNEAEQFFIQGNPDRFVDIDEFKSMIMLVANAQANNDYSSVIATAFETLNKNTLLNLKQTLMASTLHNSGNCWPLWVIR
eukprot:GABV01004529.1.p1 GENE.GABV01004529.1~~GABV01004529.1.p1  ORF type:complete len:125 (-),score=30.12 GABV01004529.1:56-430(-)